MWLRRLILGVGLAGTLAACAVVDPVDNRYDTVSRSLAKSRNESIFLNLVRASHDYPLSFVTIANVTPGMTNTTSLALPGFLLGPTFHGASLPTSQDRDVIFGNTTAGNTTAVSTNFNVSTQETSTFYQGFLKPIDLQTLNYFIRQGYSRELLFWLFTDSFELTLPGAQASLGYHFSPPDDYGCSRADKKHRCFIDWVHNAAFTGLTVEEKTVQASPAASKGGAAPGGSSPAPKSLSYARFCFNSVLAQQAAAEVSPVQVQAATRDLDVQPSMLYNSPLACGNPEWANAAEPDTPQPDILPITFGSPGSPGSIRIIPRSAYGVFEFLGTLMKMQMRQMTPSRYAFIPPGREYAMELPMLETVHEDPYLMTVLQNLGGECFVHTWFEDGDYCVPEQATTTKRIFGLLAQLIAIQTSANDLSITPIVRITQ